MPAHSPISPFSPPRQPVLNDLAESVVRVGEGRGFIVSAPRANYVITAAHVLPHLPPDFEEEPYLRFLGPRNAEPAIAVTCVFVDPVSDLAVLGAPDDETYALYETFTASLPPFAVTPPAPRGLSRAEVPAYVLSLAGWQECKVSYLGGPLLIQPANLIQGGMSGSPVISATGAALGVINQREGMGKRSSNRAFAACLTRSLPGWLLRALGEGGA